MGKYTILALILFLSCKSVKYTTAQMPEKQVIIGESGGFAGTETSYILCSSGQVFKQLLPANKTEEITGLDKNKIKNLYNKPWNKKWDSYSYDKPGNMTYFVTLKDAAKLNKISWASNDTLVLKDLKDYCQEFYQLLKTKSN